MSFFVAVSLLFASNTNFNENPGPFPITITMINWTVGDTMEYSIDLGFLKGKMTKKVASEIKVDGEPCIWISTLTDLTVMKDTVEILMRRSDGKVLKIIHNGKEIAIGDDNIEIVKQEYTEVTVPAGKFKAIYVVLNTKEVKNMEIWVNSADTVMDGMLKTILPTQFGKATIELLSFKKG